MPDPDAPPVEIPVDEIESLFAEDTDVTVEKLKTGYIHVVASSPDTEHEYTMSLYEMREKGDADPSWAQFWKSPKPRLVKDSEDSS